MIAKSAVPIDLSGIPQSTAIQNAIDAFLSVPAWGPLEQSRTYTLVWANVGGYTLAKDRVLMGVFGVYRDFGGWNVSVTSADTTSWTIVFARS